MTPYSVMGNGASYSRYGSARPGKMASLLTWTRRAPHAVAASATLRLPSTIARRSPFRYARWTTAPGRQLRTCSRTRSRLRTSIIVDGGASNCQSSASEAIPRCWPRKPDPPVMSINPRRRWDQRTRRAYGVPLPLVPAPSASAVARHPHLAEPLPAGWVRVDMHSHTMWSGDSTTTADEISAAVAASGIDVLCITDHNAIKGALELVDLLPCRVIVGEELRTNAGEIIGLFLAERIPVGLQPDDAARAIRAQGGIVYIPHPYDPMRRNLNEPALEALVDAGLVDTMELTTPKPSRRSPNNRPAPRAPDRVRGAGGERD